MSQETVETDQGLTFKEVWAAALMELKEVQKETDRIVKETAEQMKETDRKMKETDRQISRLGSRIGDLIEHLTASNIVEKFRELHYDFNHISRNHRLKNQNNQTLAEIDILLENGECALVVEVKSLLTRTDVTDHLKRMETLRHYADLHHDARKYLSAVSGALIEEGAREFALKSGVYVIVHPGEGIEIRCPETVRVW
jgi:hypothetical protein